MIIFPVTRFSIDRLLQWGAIICAAAVSIAVLLVAIFFLWDPASAGGKENHLNKSFTSANYLFPLEAIGSGALALHPKIACGWVSRIAEEFSVLAYNNRPDVLQKEANIVIALHGGKEQTTIMNGKVVFLQERQEGKGLAFAEEPTSLWVKPILLDNGSVLVEAGRKLISSEGQLVGEEKGEYIATPRGGLRLAPTSGLQELKTLRCFGCDLLIQKYGGKEYASWKDKIKIEFAVDSRTYACFIATGDLLQYQEGEWRVVTPDQINPQLPIARVKSASMKGCEIEGWDESGLAPVQVKVDLEKIAAAPVRNDLLPSSLRVRSNTQLSCLFGKKRVIIKQGDWLLRTAHGWRNLRRAEDIENCLFHRIKGDLFIFDSIEKQQGKLTLVGQLFDSARVNVSPVALTVESDKKVSKKSKKRKILSCIFSARGLPC